jgi:hypothetical protein
MATDRQIAANRLNAAKSSGPTTEEGKARSRANATKHGLAAELADLEADLSPEFRERREKWAAEENPVGEAANWALNRAVAASLRIERCERTIDELIAKSRERAKLAWDQDRAVEAATIAGRLSRNPVLVARQLEATLAGVVLLIEAWLGLVSTLGVGDWSETEASKALDLLGVAPDVRSGRTLIDSPEGTDPVAFRRELALDEVDRLEALRDAAMAPLDESERLRAIKGDLALLSKPVKLVLRYERDAWKRYNQSMKELKDPSPSPVIVASVPVPVPVPVLVPVAQPAPSLPEEIDDLDEIDMVAEDAWLDELERRIDAQPAPRVPALVTERTQFGGVAVLEVGSVEPTERTQFGGVAVLEVGSVEPLETQR